MATGAPSLTESRPAATSDPGSDVPQAEASAATHAPGLSRSQSAVLVLSVFVAGLCSIVYELLVGTASSYFLGDSVRQFSITIGLFMASMGLGSFLSRNLGRRLLGLFVTVEIVLGIVGGLSVPLLYATYAYTELYLPTMIVTITVIGALTGLEIPILVLAMRRFYELNVSLSNILSLDYLGALAATLLFPFVLLPTLGTFKSSLVIGALNLAVALVVVRAFRERIEPQRRAAATLVAFAALMALLVLIVAAQEILKPWHKAIYEDNVLVVRQSKYQKIVVTRHRNDVRLYLNGNLQFSSLDEYRYHEALVHPALSLAPRRDHVLLLGGGDGLAAREILKYGDVRDVTLVDLDAAITDLAKKNHHLLELNRGSLTSRRVTIRNEDAWTFADRQRRTWDVIVVDLPDPNDTSLARLYSREFYGLLRRALAEDGVLVTQATSPFYAREAFWCIVSTAREAGFQVRPYHANVPSFGDWGFVLAANHPLDPAAIRIAVPTRYLEQSLVGALFEFPQDVRVAGITYSTLDTPIVLKHYLAGWKKWK